MDAFLIAKYDALMTWAQRRGLHLLWLKVWWAFWLALSVLVFGSGVWLKLREFKIHKDYPEEHRRVLRLNAMVLEERETHNVQRVFYIFIWVFIIMSDLGRYFAGMKVDWLGIAMFSLVGFFLVTAMYLDCCMYLGPGEHSRQRREAYSSSMQRSGVNG